MQLKSTPRISGRGMDLDRLMNYRICAIMHFTTTAKQCSQDPKTQECGTQWEVAIKKWIRTTKHRDATRGLRVQKIDKELPFIRWESSTT